MHESCTTMHYRWSDLANGSVHRCRLPFCDVTIGLVQGRSGALLVDTGTTLVEAAAIDADVREIAGCAVTHVVLTHKHFDHVLGSSQFAGAEVFCAPEVVEYLSSATSQLRDDALSYGADADDVDRAIAALQPPRHGNLRRRRRSRRPQRDDRPPGRRPHHRRPGRGGARTGRQGWSGRGLHRRPCRGVRRPVHRRRLGSAGLAGHARSGARGRGEPTPSTSQATAMSSTPNSSVASEIGYGTVCTAKPVEHDPV